jgi:hypothetical protein
MPARRLKPGKVGLRAEQAQLGGPVRLSHDPHEQPDPQRSEREHDERKPGHLAAAKLEELGPKYLGEYHWTPPVSRRKYDSRSSRAGASSVSAIPAPTSTRASSGTRSWASNTRRWPSAGST